MPVHLSYYAVPGNKFAVTLLKINRLRYDRKQLFSFVPPSSVGEARISIGGGVISIDRTKISVGGQKISADAPFSLPNAPPSTLISLPSALQRKRGEVSGGTLFHKLKVAGAGGNENEEETFIDSTHR